MSTENEKVAFIHVPKAAGGSIKFWLKKNDLGVYVSDPLGEAHLMLNEIEDHYGKMDWSFACVRNSYQRMISFYEYTRKKFSERQHILLSRNYDNLQDFEKEMLKEANEKMDVIDKGIVYFMEKSIEQKHRAMISQVEFTKGVHHICRSENLKEDFEIVQDRLGCGLMMGKTHRVLKYNEKKYYRDKMFIDAVRDIFRDEIETFDYGFKYKR